ncbi:MAG: glycosyltransferase [Microthrixaceae bacterium]
MKVVLVGPTFPYKGGVAQHTTQLAFRLSEADVATQIVSWKSQYPKRMYPGRLEVSGGEGQPFPRTRRSLTWYNPFSWLRAGWRMRARDTLVVFCLVNALQVPAYLLMSMVARSGGASVALLCHNVVPHDAPRWQVRLNELLIGRIGRVLVHSDAEAEAAGRFGAKRIEVAALPFFLPVRPALSSGHTVTHELLFFGFVRKYKGLDTLIEAVAKCRVPVRVRAVGEFWEPVEDFTTQAERLGIGDRVLLEDRYLPSEEVAALFEGVDALVVPYRSGTGSQHPRLGHLAGVPVVATRVGDLPDQVEDGVDGRLCAPGDSSALAAAIDSLYDPGVIDAMRQRIAASPPDDGWKPYLAAVERLMVDEDSDVTRP